MPLARGLMWPAQASQNKSPVSRGHLRHGGANDHGLRTSIDFQREADQTFEACIGVELT
jgi:hypothetical protein